MIIAVSNKNGNCHINFGYDRETLDFWFSVGCFANDFGYKEYKYKTLKAAYNKLESFCKQYHID